MTTKKALAEIKQQIDQHAKELEKHEETWKGISEVRINDFGHRERESR